MAAGCTQPGGAGTTILIEDDSHADAGGDGSYSFLDIATKFPADFVDLGTTPKSYRAKVSVTNGDGAGTAVTTLKDSDAFVVFDAGKTYSVSTTGRANRFTEMGVLVDGTRDSGKNLVSIVFGASTIIQGNAKFYGTTLKATTGNIILAPGQTGLLYNVINCILWAVTGAVAIGVPSIASADTVYNVDVIGGSFLAGAINNFGATSAERITVALNPAGTAHLRTNSVFSVRDMVCIGIGAGTGGQIRIGGSGTTLIAPTWDRGLPIKDPFHGAVVDEYWPYDVTVTDGAAAPIAGLPITVVDGLGATVISTTTAADGGLSYGSGTTAGCLKVTSYVNAATTTYQGPWTLRVNQGAGMNSNWPQRTILFDFRVAATWTGGVQYQQVFDIIQLIPPGGAPTGWQELSM